MDKRHFNNNKMTSLNILRIFDVKREQHVEIDESNKKKFNSANLLKIEINVECVEIERKFVAKRKVFFSDQFNTRDQQLAREIFFSS